MPPPFSRIKPYAMLGARDCNPFGGGCGGTKDPLFPHLVKKGDRELTMEEAIHILTVAAPMEFKELCGFGPDVEGPFRTLIEPVIANDQCERAGVQFVPGTTPCWLCGCVIGPGEAKACEHIIPALRATMLKGLVTTKKITQGIYDSATDIGIFDAITIGNYLWSHENCNGSAGKGRMVLIKFDQTTNRFVPDDVKCAELQEKIRGLGRRVCYDTAGGVLYSKTRLDPATGNIINTDTQVKSPFDVYMFEIEQQCVSINREFAAVGDLPLFAKYALNRVELYFTMDALSKRGTPEERAAASSAKKREIEAEINRAYELLQQDMLLAKEYISRVTPPSDDVSTIDQKMAYFSQYIEKFLLPLHNLESGKNNSLSYSIIGILSTMRDFLAATPISDALPIVYIITMRFLFSTEGPLRTLNTHRLIPEFPINRRGPSKSHIITMIQRVMGGRKTGQRKFETDFLFATPDGRPDNAKFNAFICPLLSTFLYQTIKKIIFASKPDITTIDTFKPFFSSVISSIPRSVYDNIGIAECVDESFITNLFKQLYVPGTNMAGPNGYTAAELAAFSNEEYTEDEWVVIDRFYEFVGRELLEGMSKKDLMTKLGEYIRNYGDEHNELLLGYIRNLFEEEEGGGGGGGGGGGMGGGAYKRKGGARKKYTRKGRRNARKTRRRF
jgi:hypothetical protein